MLNISKDVIASITGITLENLKGVVQNKPETKRKNIKIERDGDSVTIEVQVLLDYSADMLGVCSTAQNNITENIELMTGLKVRSVNIVVHDISPSSLGSGIHS